MSTEPVEIKRTAEYYLRRALDNDRKGALFDALKLYRKAFENGIDSAEALLMASIAASRMGYTGLAGKYITEAMLRNCPEPDCLCAIGFSLCAQRRMRDAQRILDLLPLTRGGETALRRLAEHPGAVFCRTGRGEAFQCNADLGSLDLTYATGLVGARFPITEMKLTRQFMARKEEGE